MGVKKTDLFISECMVELKCCRKDAGHTIKVYGFNAIRCAGIQVHEIFVPFSEHSPDKLKSELKKKVCRKQAARKRLRVTRWEEDQQQQDMQKERTGKDGNNAALPDARFPGGKG